MPEADSSSPNYIYKLVPSSSPVPLNQGDLPESLPVSAIDEKSGFIHASTSTQVPNILKIFFADDSFVYVLRIRYKDLDRQIRWEDPKAEICGPRGGEGLFPHIYNGLKLGKDEIESVYVLENGPDGWDAALVKAEEWLLW